MSAHKENLLEKGYWDDGRDQPETKSSLQARATKWATEIVRPLARGSSQPQKLRRTAWLDGLRGFAALIVYWHHHQLWCHDAMGNDVMESAFGYDRQYYFAQLPGVRTFFSGGHYAVTCFFVISGYVLSAKPMSLIQAGDHHNLTTNVSSALFRRWPRLFLPIIATTFIYMTTWHMFGMWAVPDPKPTYREELWSWYNEFKNFSFVFRSGGEPWFTYNFHAWSIPTEFKGSIVVYTTLLALSRCRKNVRLAFEVALIYYYLYIADGWFCALFMSGMLLCDLDLLAAKGELPDFLAKLEPYKSYIFCTLLAISNYLGGVPSRSFDVTALRNSFGWYYLSFLKPQAVFDYKWFYLFWAATLLVASVPRIPLLKRFFELPFNQYLGRVCFGLYIVHGPVLWTIGDRIYAATGWSKESNAIRIPGWINLFPLPKIGPFGLEIAYLLPQLILLPLTLWIAEIVTRTIDEPSLKLTQWAYQKAIASDERNEK